MPEQESAAFVEEEDCSREFDELYYSSVVTSHKKTDRQASLESAPWCLVGINHIHPTSRITLVACSQEREGCAIGAVESASAPVAAKVDDRREGR